MLVTSIEEHLANILSWGIEEDLEANKQHHQNQQIHARPYLAIYDMAGPEGLEGITQP